MEMDNDEKRRFMLWSIGRANRPVAPGPNDSYPIHVSNKKSISRFPVISPVVLNFLKRITRNKALVGICLGVVLISCNISFIYQLLLSPQAVASRAVSRAGGVAHPTYTSRFVFQNPKLQPSDVIGLVPYLKNIPIAEDVKTMPRCVVLDFQATPRIDDRTVMELVQQLKNTIIFYHGKNGDQWRASNDLRQEMVQRANRNTGKQ